MALCGLMGFVKLWEALISGTALTHESFLHLPLESMVLSLVMLNFDFRLPGLLSIFAHVWVTWMAKHLLSTCYSTATMKFCLHTQCSSWHFSLPFWNRDPGSHSVLFFLSIPNVTFYPCILKGTVLSHLWVRRNYFLVRCYLKGRPSQKIRSLFSLCLYLLFFLFIIFFILMVIQLFPPSSIRHIPLLPTVEQYTSHFPASRSFLFDNLKYFEVSIVDYLWITLLRRRLGRDIGAIIFVHFPRKSMEAYHSGKIINVIPASSYGCKEYNVGACMPRTFNKSCLTISGMDLLPHQTFTESE